MSRQAAPPLDTDRLRRLIDVVLPEAQERAKLAGEIRTALEAGENDLAIRLMRRYVGLPPAEAA